MNKPYPPKPQFIERIQSLLKDKQDVNKFFGTAKTKPRKSIRVNTLKITPQELTDKLNKHYNEKQIEILEDLEI